MELTFYREPGPFLAVAGPWLARDPVLSTVVSTVSQRMVGAELPTSFPCWWLTVTDGPDVVGVAMRTAPFAPHPLYLLPMPTEAAVALAHALHERGEQVDGVNGAMPASLEMAQELARLSGRVASVHRRQRLFDLPALIEPRSTPGALRAATSHDLALCREWFAAFHVDAAAQANRAVGPETGEHFTEAEVLARIEAGVVHLWEHDGVVVHLAGANKPAYGVVRVGPVYTPPTYRGHGYASAAVAEISRRVLNDGHRACLFTDLANPTSNKIYEALGYRGLVDMGMVTLA